MIDDDAMADFSRRRFCVGAAAAGAIGWLDAAAQSPAQSPAPPDVAALLAGQVNDRGFMEAGYRGLIRARDKLGLHVQ